MSIEQKLFDKIFKILKEKGYRVYDYLPPEGTTYPFIHLGEVTLTPRPTKGYWLADLEVNINIWNSEENRKIVSEINKDIIISLRNLDEFKLAPAKTNIRLIKDNSTTQKLWHGVLDLSFIYG